MKTHDESFVSNTAAGIYRAVTSKYAFLGEFSVLEANAVDYCNVTLMKQQFYMSRWAFIHKKGWKYKAELDNA